MLQNGAEEEILRSILEEEEEFNGDSIQEQIQKREMEKNEKSVTAGEKGEEDAWKRAERGAGDKRDLQERSDNWKKSLGMWRRAGVGERGSDEEKSLGLWKRGGVGSRCYSSRSCDKGLVCRKRRYSQSSRKYCSYIGK